MELDNAISEYFALKKCELEASLSNKDTRRIIESNQCLFKSIDEYEKGSSHDRKEGS